MADPRSGRPTRRPSHHFYRRDRDCTPSTEAAARQRMDPASPRFSFPCEEQAVDGQVRPSRGPADGIRTIAFALLGGGCLVAGIPATRSRRRCSRSVGASEGSWLHHLDPRVGEDAGEVALGKPARVGVRLVLPTCRRHSARLAPRTSLSDPRTAPCSTVSVDRLCVEPLLDPRGDFLVTCLGSVPVPGKVTPPPP